MGKQRSNTYKSEGELEKFVFLTDLHWGYELKGGHKKPLHDIKALNVAMKFIKDYKPDYIILGGDILDCGAISHHNHGKPGATEGLKLRKDAQELRREVLEPLEASGAELVYIEGNHEAWLAQLEEAIPALEGLVDLRSILGLSDKRWTIIPQGDFYKLGKLVFIHGDTVRGGEHHAKWGAYAYEGNVRFGHYHTYQAYTKLSALEGNGHTAIVVPCLCHKRPKYGKGAPNKWMQGFLYGAVEGPQGVFGDSVAIIVNGKSVINGKVYEG